MVTPTPVLDNLETERLLLRRRRVDEAEIFRHLWTERDERVPPHRRIDADGRPSVDDIAALIRAERASSVPGVLAVQVKESQDVIGYCGLVFQGNGSSDGGSFEEPEIAFELRRTAHGRGYATEAGQAVVEWAGSAGYPRLWASVWDWNAASRRVLEKLGFHEAGRDEPGAYGINLLTVREL